MTPLCGAAATRLRFQKGSNIPDLVSNRRAVDAPERAAHVQSPFVLQHLHAAPADGGVYALVDPRPWDRGHLRQIDRPGNAAHILTPSALERPGGRFLRWRHWCAPPSCAASIQRDRTAPAAGP